MKENENDYVKKIEYEEEQKEDLTEDKGSGKNKYIKEKNG